MSCRLYYKRRERKGRDDSARGKARQAKVKKPHQPRSRRPPLGSKSKVSWRKRASTPSPVIFKFFWKTQTRRVSTEVRVKVSQPKKPNPPPPSLDLETKGAARRKTPRAWHPRGGVTKNSPSLEPGAASQNTPQAWSQGRPAQKPRDWLQRAAQGSRSARARRS